MDKIEQEDDWYTLGQIGQYITAEHPDFDTRTSGKRKLSDLATTYGEDRYRTPLSLRRAADDTLWIVYPLVRYEAGRFAGMGARHAGRRCQDLGAGGLAGRL